MTFTAKARNVSRVPFLYDSLPEELAIILIVRQEHRQKATSSRSCGARETDSLKDHCHSSTWGETGLVRFDGARFECFKSPLRDELLVRQTLSRDNRIEEIGNGSRQAGSYRNFLFRRFFFV